MLYLTLKTINMALPQSEEKVMTLLWEMGEASASQLIEKYPDPKPASTTVLTLLKRLADKGYVNYKVNGRTRIYFPNKNKEEYSSSKLNNFVRKFFNGSTSQFASFFTKNAELSQDELKKLRDIIDDQIDEK